jgi:PleD family two-component response regulator
MMENEEEFDEKDSESDDETDDRPRVLIVHSKRYDMNNLREMLHQIFKLKTTNSGVNALKLVKDMSQRSPIDLIIMEPDKNGLEAAIQIHELVLPEGLPLIYAYSRTPPAEEQIEAYFTGILQETSEFVAY